MSERVAAELAAKEKRVVGVLVFMVGAGLVIDRHALWAGALTMLSGAAVFLWGLLVTRGSSIPQPEGAATQPLERTP